MKKENFGSIYGRQVTQYTLTNGRITAEIIDYGASLRSLKLKLKDGSVKDVVLGYNTVEEYATHSGYLGATVGRVANRIGGSRYTLNGKEYRLNNNDGENTLHGGVSGFNDKVWEAVEVSDHSVTFKYFSKNGEEGFNGNLETFVKYTVTEKNSIKIEYRAVSDEDTPVSLTNHSYFNLDGECGESVFNTELTIYADKITAVDENLITDGTFMPVKDSVYDFTKGKKIGDYFNSSDKFMKKFGCYDVCYVLNGNGYRKIATAKNENSGIEMEVYSDMVGVQLYTETFLDGRKGKSGTYKKGSAFCLETQHLPNAINCKEYPSCVLKKGEEYVSTTEYLFKF